MVTLQVTTRFPKFAIACLQMVADGYTVEDAARYVGCEYELAEDLLAVAGNTLGATNIEQSVAAAVDLGLIV